MKWTNLENLDEPIANAIMADVYTRGDADLSVTELIDSPRIVALKRKHENDITKDVSDAVHSLIGQGFHTVLERANIKGVAERRLSITVEGWKLSGGMDLFRLDGVLVDYKTTSAWSVLGGRVKPEWVEQLNCYAQILRENGDTVNGLKISAYLRDWSRTKAKQSADYPRRQMVQFEIPLWTEAKAKKFIRERVILHKQAQVELPQCSRKDTWQEDDVFAVKKKDAARALKLYPTESLAKEHLEHSKEAGLVIEHRKGEAKRCEDFCDVSAFCTQFNPLLKMGKT